MAVDNFYVNNIDNIIYYAIIINNMSKILREQLIKYGFTEKEAAVYLAALELGSGTPLEISKKSNVKRPTTYLILGSLMAKGFVIRSLKERTQVFVAQPPKKILELLTDQLTDFRDLLPQLAAIHNLEKRKPKIMIFEGEEAPDRAYMEVLQAEGELRFISPTSEIYERYPKTIKLFEKKPKNENFSVREILFDEPSAYDYVKRNKGPFHQIRFLPKNLKPCGSDLGICGDKILISSLQDEIFIVSIEDRKIVQLMRLWFDLLWQNLAEE